MVWLSVWCECTCEREYVIVLAEEVGGDVIEGLSDMVVCLVCFVMRMGQGGWIMEWPAPYIPKLEDDDSAG